MIDEGWEDVTTDYYNFFEMGIQSGDRIRYTCYGRDSNNEAIEDEVYFRIGGWVISVDKDWLVVKGHAGFNFSVNNMFLERLYIFRSRNHRPIKDIKLKKPVEGSKYPVYVNGKLVASFENHYKMERFMQTAKFQKIANGAEYEFD
jgi:hypothetical protein